MSFINRSFIFRYGFIARRSVIPLFALASLLFVGCRKDNIALLTSQGVSKELADYRSSRYSDVNYDLCFNLSNYPDTLMRGEVTISLKRKPSGDPVIIDFKDGAVLSVKDSEGNNLDYCYENEHIVINQRTEDSRYHIQFIPISKSVNRRNEFVYTLLVPDRARLLFPLFDQPDIKARYTLKLKTPEQWKAVSNGAIDTESVENGTKTTTFKQSEPISGYLFAFCAGVFNVEEKKRGEDLYRIYHRESEEAHLSQFDDIFEELFYAIDWLEEYTGVEYPFSKYDLVLIPGFQYGGMEHAGATFYNASTMFLGPSPTIDQRLARAKLIAHETSHMWFGDYVTMKWFNEVWIKEVFANYFAAKIAAPQFPEIESDNSMVSCFSAAMGEDRTEGAQPILQDLDNLRYAGLIYNSIIYNKSPIIFSMITLRMGEDAFKKAIRKYMNEYAYGCATWDDLVRAFDTCSEGGDISEWSGKWMRNRGMPRYKTEVNGSALSLSVSYPTAKGVIPEQNISFDLVYDDGTVRRVTVDSKSERSAIEIAADPVAVLPNCDAMSYGCFELDSASVEYIFDNFTSITPMVAKRSLLITMHENMLNHRISAERFITRFIPSLINEKDDLPHNALLSYVMSSATVFAKDSSVIEALDGALWEIYDNPERSEAIRYNSLMAVSRLMCSEQSEERIYGIWRSEKPEVKLSENDYIKLSQSLALAFPQRAERIIEEQKSRIKSTDKLEEYNFVSSALDSNAEKRWEFFLSLRDVKNRCVENWVVQSLALLTYRGYNEQEKSEYVFPALELLPEIQRTGDIFFPQRWCSSILSGCRDSLSLKEVQNYLNQTPDLHPLLKSKIQIASHHLTLLSDSERK